MKDQIYIIPIPNGVRIAVNGVCADKPMDFREKVSLARRLLESAEEDCLETSIKRAVND